jgi:hypothetical protein
LGQVLALLHETKRAIEKHELEHAIDTLSKVEGLLFGLKEEGQ